MKARGRASRFRVTKGWTVTRRMIAPLIFGLVGAGILIWLGSWQVQRMVWKNTLIDRIEAQIYAAPAPVSAVLGPDPEQFLPVEATGRYVGLQLHVLSSIKLIGPVYRVIQAFVTQAGDRIMVDRGYILEDQKAMPVPSQPGQTRIVGNFRTPQEVDGFTPPPDLQKNIWFARDVPKMAEVLKTLPVLVILRETTEANPAITPMPVSTEGIPNNHRNYAITWFSLAIVWLGMTGFLLWRMRRTTDKD